jgi:pimeloyl-ACP methyl ester carboxylesterase
MRAPAIERFVNVRGLDLHVLDWPGARPPVLLIHPNRTLNRTWDHVVAASRLPNRFVAPGLRGHGLSSYPPDGYTLEAHRDDCIATIEALGLGPCCLVGQGTGATLALLVATARSDLALAIVAAQPAIGIPPAVNDLVQRQVVEQATFADRDAARRALPFAERWTPAIVEHYLDRALARRADGRYAWRYFGPGVRATEADLLRDLWGAIRYDGPVLVFGGAESSVLPQSMFDRLAAMLPRAERATLAGANHRLSQDNPSGFAALLDAFVTRSCAAAS